MKKIEYGNLYVDRYGSLHQIDNLGNIVGVANHLFYNINFSHQIKVTSKLLKQLFPNINYKG